MKPKRDLFRIVAADDQLVLDLSGRRQGRGAYLCQETACVDKALNERRLEQNLRSKRSTDLAEELQKALDDVRLKAAKTEGPRVHRLSKEQVEAISIADKRESK